MADKRIPPLDRVLARLDTLDTIDLAHLVQRLARERGLFEEIFNTLQEGVLVIGPDGTIEYANGPVHRLIGLSGADLAGRILWRLVPGLRPSLGAAMDSPESTSGQPAVTHEFELSYPEPRTLRLYMVPFRGDGRGAPRRFAVILADIPREKQAAGKRLENERTSSILFLAAGVAHELGNPLNSLTIHLQLIGRKLKKLKASPELASVSESISVCREEVQRLDGIVRNFLEAIQPRPPNLSEINLTDVLSEVLRVQRESLPTAGSRSRPRLRPTCLLSWPIATRSNRSFST